MNRRRSMLYKTFSAAVYGIDANIIEVEVDVSGAKLNEVHFTLSASLMPPYARARIACARRCAIVVTTFRPPTSP